jgi:hypothetical protein
MKTTIKFLGILTLVLVTAFAMISCSEDEPEPEVKTDAVSPLITVNPLNAAYLPGAAVTPLSVTANASDGGALSYQWYSETTMYSNPTAVPGATSATFTPPTATAGTLYYYAEVTNTNNGVNGNKTAVQTSRRAKFVVGWEEATVVSDDIVDGTLYLFSPTSIIFANNRFVAVGGYISHGQIGWSDDGIKWTILGNGNSAINGIAYGNGKFIAVGDDGKMASSADGKTWTSLDASTIFGTSNINDIAYGNNQFFAVSQDGKSGYLKDNDSTWTSCVSGLTIIFGSSVFIESIVYDSANSFTITSRGRSASLIDNILWSPNTISDGPVKITTINDLISAGNYMVAVGNDGNVLKCTGSSSWTNISPSTVLGTNTINKAAYGANKLLVFSSSSSKGAWSSDNGTTWTEVPYISMSRMAYGAGRFVAIPAGGFGISYSKYP